MVYNYGFVNRTPRNRRIDNGANAYYRRGGALLRGMRNIRRFRRRQAVYRYTRNWRTGMYGRANRRNMGRRRLYG